MGSSSGESRNLIFCPNTEQRFVQMQFVIWVLKPSAVGICLSVTSIPRTAAVYEAHRDFIFITQCILKLVMWYVTTDITHIDISCDNFLIQADPSDLVVKVLNVRRLACWGCRFESHRWHWRLSLVSIVCCQVEMSVTVRSLVQRNPTDIVVCVCVRARARYIKFDIQRTVHCDIFIIKKWGALISEIYFWNRTLRVSDSFSVHHQKSSTVYTATGIGHTGCTDCLLRQSA